MKPFEISDISHKLVAIYPHPQELVDFRGADQKEREGFVRLWMTEGIPYLFREMPLLYESLRDWIGIRLSVHPKQVTMIGSGRLGYSLDPRRYGKIFCEKSDVDLNVISEELLRGVSESFEVWKKEVEENKIRPSNERQKKFWESSLKQLPMNIRRGFADPYLIPSLERYPVVYKVRQVEYTLAMKLKSMPEYPSNKGISIRVYRDWKACVNQMLINFNHTLSALQ